MSIIAFNDIQPQFCVNAKVRRIHRLLNSPYQDLIKPYGLKGSMLSILFMIGKTDANQKLISNQLVLDESTMSRDIKKLESMHLIERAKGVDARHTVLTISDSGSDLLDEVAPKWQALHDRMIERIGQENITALDQIMASLEKHDA
jgi:DNA-binding MarR family transcriptional regulator